MDILDIYCTNDKLIISLNYYYCSIISLNLIIYCIEYILNIVFLICI